LTKSGPFFAAIEQVFYKNPLEFNWFYKIKDLAFLLLPTRTIFFI